MNRHMKKLSACLLAGSMAIGMTTNAGITVRASELERGGRESYLIYQIIELRLRKHGELRQAHISTNIRKRNCQLFAILAPIRLKGLNGENIMETGLRLTFLGLKMTSMQRH